MVLNVGNEHKAENKMQSKERKYKTGKYKKERKQEKKRRPEGQPAKKTK